MSLSVLITGSAGFIGFHTVKALLARGDIVIGLDNLNLYYDAKLKERRNEVLEKYENFTCIRGDIKDTAKLQEAFSLLIKPSPCPPPPKGGGEGESGVDSLPPRR